MIGGNVIRRKEEGRKTRNDDEERSKEGKKV
jgi:hypothetical protein